MNPSPQAWRTLGIAALVITLGACTPEQPPSFAATLPPAIQSTLQEMSALAARGSVEPTYAYTMTNTCDLHATKLLNGHPIKWMVFPLGSTHFERYDYAKSLGYAVRTVNQSGGIDDVAFEADSVELIESMLQLLEKIKTACRGAVSE